MTDAVIAAIAKNIAREIIRKKCAAAVNAKFDYAGALGIAKSDSSELRALKLESSKLQTAALKAFPQSPKQKAILVERDKLQQKIKELEEKEKAK